MYQRVSGYSEKENKDSIRRHNVNFDTHNYETELSQGCDFFLSSDQEQEENDYCYDCDNTSVSITINERRQPPVIPLLQIQIVGYIIVKRR